MEMSTSNEVKLTLRLRNGQQVEFAKPCGVANGEVDFGTLNKALCSVQQESNEFLTTIVEEEKASGANPTTTTEAEEDSEDEDDEDDEEDEDGSGDTSLNGPAEKKQKI